MHAHARARVHACVRARYACARELCLKNVVFLKYVVFFKNLLKFHNYSENLSFFRKFVGFLLSFHNQSENLSIFSKIFRVWGAEKITNLLENCRKMVKNCWNPFCEIYKENWSKFETKRAARRTFSFVNFENCKFFPAGY